MQLSHEIIMKNIYIRIYKSYNLAYTVSAFN